MEFMPPLWVREMLQQVGPFAILLVVLFWYVPRRAVTDFIGAQQGQAVALSGIKDALGLMAEKGDRLEDKLDITILNQRLMIGQLEKMEDRTEGMHAANSVQIKTLQELILSGRKAPEPVDPPANP